MFSPEDFHAVMSLLDSMKDGSEETEKGTEEADFKQEEKQDDKKTGKKEEEGSKRGGASSEIHVSATVGVVNLLLHSSNHGKLAAIAVQGMVISLAVVPWKHSSPSLFFVLCSLFLELTTSVKVLPDEIGVSAGYVWQG